jgi:murein DD-endopeptidase MepM/ murein hydrolase activator NlpD
MKPQKAQMAQIHARPARRASHPERKASVTSWLVFAAALGFLAGMLVMAAVVTIFPSGAAIVADAPVEASSTEAAPATVAVKPSLKETPPAVDPPPAPTVAAAPAISADPFADLRQRQLTLPVDGIKKDDLRDNFNEMRGTRRHEAIDVLAPRNTPVLAVEDGTIAKLFYSEAGGITIYQFDPTENYVYYYAHLERYADDVREGRSVTRGHIIGYVGTTGNAPRDTPHLHFAIFKMGEDKKWWQGTPIDPYSVLR